LPGSSAPLYASMAPLQLSAGGSIVIVTRVVAVFGL
jgi:hypothetical protein